MDEDTKSEITQQLSEIILDVMPDATMLEKYGGIVVERIAGQPKTQCCGYFVYAGHVSLEFTQGVQLLDPDNILQGGGKLRRHIKLKDIQDVAEKQCKTFLKQAARL